MAVVRGTPCACIAWTCSRWSQPVNAKSIRNADEAIKNPRQCKHPLPRAPPPELRADGFKYATKAVKLRDTDILGLALPSPQRQVVRRCVLCACRACPPWSPGRGARHARHGLVAPTTCVLVLGSQGGPSLRSCVMTYESLSRPTPLPLVVILFDAVRHRQGAPIRHNDDIEGMSPQFVLGGAWGRCLAVNADWVRGHLLSKLFAALLLIRPGLASRGIKWHRQPCVLNQSLSSSTDAAGAICNFRMCQPWGRIKADLGSSPRPCPGQDRLGLLRTFAA